MAVLELEAKGKGGNSSGTLFLNASSGTIAGELIGVTPGGSRACGVLMVFGSEEDNNVVTLIDEFWEFITSARTAFIRLLLDSSSSIVFSMAAMKDFFRSRVILACIRFRSRLN